ncbi:olfactory receptor 10Z1-like [Echinops telfairi]|uniref:Olfactory receptor 10Z1-like n=1 Tax=Echinops telfairi TaxID=9371 RepID=A0ABM0J793_ECHTE|nr:olfactory receptor 10Z1-like [Echinops telfairi]
MRNQTAGTTFLLWGFSSFPDLKGLLFVVVFFSHVTILVANGSIMVAITLSRNLHTPMYFFLCGLSLSETCATVVIIPRMLVDLVSESSIISLPECATQMLCFLCLAANNCFIMAAMSYDRYTAIHNPLNYHMLMTGKICCQLMTASLVTGFLISLGIVLTAFNLPFCGSKIIHHFFCDISPVVLLACGYTFFHEMVIFVLSALVLVGSFILIMVSYVFIVSVVVKMPSAKGRYKAFSTCSSHLTVVCIHYGFACSVYLKPKNSASFHEDMLMAVTYTVLTPLLNPIVYSLRNREMQTSLWKLINRANK